ncbi:hypothetical protein [Mesorhizobium sp.]|uniref:hypothetical protein n=1 Tax=Mesorhizobium sp. TaxID=1871066 RepID=UPI000FE53DA9|nr:hypothetical protein [Mesorhizobium sp.]RWB66310.1 MAG: hypothetical protein EOQ49_29325 [Mesorhizobium sp.]
MTAESSGDCRSEILTADELARLKGLCRNLQNAEHLEQFALYYDPEGIKSNRNPQLKLMSQGELTLLKRLLDSINARAYPVRAPNGGP